MSKGRRKKLDPSFICPHCGAEVRTGASACPECGSDDSTGWSDDADEWGGAVTDGYGGDNDFDYEEFVKREFGDRPNRAFGPPLWLLILALIVIVALFLLAQRTF